MTKHRFVPVLVLACVLGCADNSRFGEPAAECAEVVRIHLRLPNAVEVTAAPEPGAGAPVSIDFQYVNDLNLPATGKATCSFAPGEEGALSLQGASVDGVSLPKPEIDRIADVRAGER